MSNPFKLLNKFEKSLWLFSMSIILLSYVISGFQGTANMLCSLVGVTSLIFIAKGHVFGMLLCTFFATYYGVLSCFFRYWSEVITYVGMTLPMDIAALVSWIKNPYKDTKEVKVAKLSKKQIAVMYTCTLAVTVAFYYILKALDTPRLFVSTLSISTSFLAVMLTYFRSPFYALAYSANDIVLVVLWIYASLTDASCIPIVMCFGVFLINDLYGFYNWKKMQKKQLMNK